MAFASEHSPKHFFKTSIEAKLLHQNHPSSSSSSSPNVLKSLSLSVSFNGWKLANTHFKSWAKKMSALHKPIWEKAGIFEAIMSSTIRIHRNTDLVLSVTEKWCHETKTFFFPWGESTITLEDVMILLGFSVLGSPVFVTLDSSGEMIKEKLEREWLKIKKNQVKFVTQVVWMGRFMDSGDDDDNQLEHVAFLALWLSYFVFPSRYYQVDIDLFSLAVHLSSGNKIALAPYVLAHLYEELSLLKKHIQGFDITKVTEKVEITSLFKLVQVWTWERFKKLQPKPVMLLEGEPRIARWDGPKKQMTKDVIMNVLNHSEMDSFEWRPYTKVVLNWKFPKFYPEKEMSVSVGPNLDDEFISFARCINVFMLVGVDFVVHYSPNRVASQFGLLQDVPCPVKNRDNLTREAAWDEYNKPIDDSTLYIPSRSSTHCFTPMYFEWWRKYSLEKDRVVESLTPRNIVGGDDDTSNDVLSCSRRQEDMKQIRYQTQVLSVNDDDEDEDRLTISQVMRLRKKKCSAVVGNIVRDASEQLGSLRDDTVIPQEIEQMNVVTDENRSKERKNTVPSLSDESNSSEPLKVKSLSQLLQELGEGFAEKRKRSRQRRRTRNVRSVIKKGKIGDCTVVSSEVPLSEMFEKNISRDISGGVAFGSLEQKDRLEEDNNDLWICLKLVSEDEANAPRETEKRSQETDKVEETGSKAETRQECDVNRTNAEKKITIVEDGAKEGECLLHEDGDKQRSKEKKDDGYVERLKQKRFAVQELASKLEARFMKAEKILANIRM